MSKRNSFAMGTRTEKRIKLIPPDGGWGWMVLLGTAITNIFNQSMLSLFSLLYGDAIEAMGHDTSGAAIVMSSMLFVTNFGGPIAGALTKLTSPRFVAVLGACSCTTGIFLSGFSTSLWHLMMTYGVLLGLGLGFIQNSSFVAINSYFKIKKSVAVGLAMAGTGVGQTLMPHVVTYFLEHFGFRGACILLSSLSLHGIFGTILIQPVEWHMKKIEEDVVVDEKKHLLAENKNGTVDKNGTEKTEAVFKNGRRATVPAVLYENGTEITNNKKVSQSYKELQSKTSIKSDEKINGNFIKPAIQKKTLMRKIYELFDISLLSSPRFINIILGTALTVVSIQNFSMLYPLFLQKGISLSKRQAAYCMSAVAFVDIVGRLVLPVVQQKYDITARMMLVLTSTWIIVVRQIIAYQSDLYALLILSGLYGFGRSMIIVARNIAISDHCTMDQVPSAVGLGMLSMGIIVPPAGYFLGWIRDYTESYIVCITAQNLILIVFLIMWIPDMLYVHLKAKKEKRKTIEDAMS